MLPRFHTTLSHWGSHTGDETSFTPQITTEDQPPVQIRLFFLPPSSAPPTYQPISNVRVRWGEGECSGSGACHQQQQQQQQQQQTGSFGSWVRRHGPTPDNGAAADAPAIQQPDAAASPQQQALPPCMKCKAAPAVTTIRQNEPYCHACIDAGVQLKSRACTRAIHLVTTGDRVLLALSGGAASTALLHCMCSMQAPPHSQRPAKGKVPFQLSVLHINCSMAQPAAAAAATAAQQPAAGANGMPQRQQQLQAQLAALAAAAGYTQQQPLLLQLSDVFASDQQLQQLLADQQQEVPDGNGAASAAEASHDKQQDQQQQQQRLQELLAAVTDPTGREDLITHLRDRLLVRAAAALQCNRLVRGDSASRLAVRIVAEASKGRGFSLPADLQLLDGRFAQQGQQQQQQEGRAGGLCVLQPLREVTHKELRELCSYRHLPLLHTDASGSSGSSGSGANGSLLGSAAAASSVNVLAQRFISEMEASLPASIYTITRTAAHLEPFDFTDVGAFVPQAAEAMQKRQRHKPQHQPQQQERQQRQEVSGVEGQQQGGSSGGGVEGVSALQWQLCSICRAPLPPQQHPSAAAAGGGVHVPGQEGSGNASVGESQAPGGISCRHVCYSCNRQILQQVKVPAAVGSAGGGGGGVASVSLEQKMQRLRALLPPGMLLEDSDHAGDEVAGC